MYCEYGIKSKVIKTNNDSGSNFVKAFSVFAPSEDDLDVCTIDASDILSTDLNSQLPTHHKCAAYLSNLICTTDAAVAEQNHRYKKVSQGILSNVKLYGIKQPEVFLQLKSWKTKARCNLNVLVPRDGILCMMQCDT